MVEVVRVIGHAAIATAREQTGVHRKMGSWAVQSLGFGLVGASGDRREVVRARRLGSAYGTTR